MIDTKLLTWATPTQRGYVEAVNEHGSARAAATALGLHHSSVTKSLDRLRRVAAKSGYAPDHDMTHTAPDSFHVHGVSTMYDGDGNVRAQWVKTHADREAQLELLREAFEEFAAGYEGRAAPIAVPALSADDLLAVIPIGDPHVGMFSWLDESGQNWDLKIAEKHLIGAVDRVVAAAPACAQALVVFLGDFFHADNGNSTTTAGTPVDTDSRRDKVVQTGIVVAHRTIDRALERHAQVRVIIEIGNHDRDSSRFLAHCMAAWYRNEERVTIDMSPQHHHWYRFGQNLIGTTHGDKMNARDLPMIMAANRATDWGETTFRRWYCGHVHHDTRKEYRGCTVETFRTIAPKDAWHASKGYSSGQDMRCDVIHRKWGQIEQHTIGIERLRMELGQ